MCMVRMGAGGHTIDLDIKDVSLSTLYSSWLCLTGLGQEKRGVHVKVWSFPPYSTNVHLRAMERGDYGAIYR